MNSKKLSPILVVILALIGSNLDSIVERIEYNNARQALVLENDTSRIFEFKDPVFQNALCSTGMDLNRDGKISQYEADTHNEGKSIMFLDPFPITSLEGIENFTNLRSLDIEGSSIDDLTPLSKMQSLEYISIIDSKISDITPLYGLKNLDTLILPNNEIEDATQFFGFAENFSTLNIEGNPFLEGNEEKVIIGHIGVSGRRHYDVYVDPKEVDDSLLQTSKIINFKDENLKQGLLEYGIDISGDGEISEYEAGRWHGDIQLKTRAISNLSGIENFNSISKLILSENEIANADILTTLDQLQVLDVSRNRISEFKNIGENTTLKVLNISRNEVSSISDILAFKELEVLIMHRSNLSSLDGIEHLKQIREISVAGNKLTSIDFEYEMQSLKLLEMSNNPISQLNGVKKFKNLQSLWINDCNVSEIGLLMELDSLESLRISGNPIYNESTIGASYMGTIAGHEVWSKE